MTIHIALVIAVLTAFTTLAVFLLTYPLKGDD